MESSWDYKPFQDFLCKTMEFMEKHCVDQYWFLRGGQQTDFELDEEQKKIESGSLEFLKVENCNTIISPLFKWFLQSFHDRIIREDIVDGMRLISGKLMSKYKFYYSNIIIFFCFSFKDNDVNSELQGVFNRLNDLPLPNKLLLNQILKIFHRTLGNKWSKEGLASLMEHCLTPVDYTMRYHTENKVVRNPMLAHFIQKWDVTLYFDEKDDKFKIKT